MQPASKRDPVLREIVANALETLATELGAFSARSAYSPFINQLPEIATGIFDRQGRLITQAKHSLAHASAVRIAEREMLKRWPLESMEEGDAIVFNDQFRGGIHPTDVMIFSPIFYRGEVVFMYGAMMIVSDLGGLSAAGLPANATEVFHEGLVIPPVRLYRRGGLNPDVAELIASNSRTPVRVMGDIRALVAGGNLAASRLPEMLDKYGKEELLAITEELMDYSERLTRQGIERIPDGVYHGSYVVEEDGIVPDKSYEVKLTMTVEGSNCRLDFTGSSPQTRGAVNSSYSQSLSGVVHALLSFLNPNIPFNEGLYRPLEVVFPLGSIVNPKYPGACNIRIGAVAAIVDCIFDCLGQAFPDERQAPGGIPQTFMAAGKFPNSDEMWSLLDPHFGPCGARALRDGVDMMPDPLFGGQTAYGRNIENYEAEYPVRYERYAVWPDSGGPGRWRGGATMVKEVTFLTEADLTTRAVDRCKIPPQGLMGGKPGKGGGYLINRGRPDQWKPANKQTNIRIAPGTSLTMTISGGGGFGDPMLREPERVAADVEEGLVTIEGAARDYSVVINPTTGKPDLAATKRLHPR
jgi:N-methylhydantoinase B